MVVGSPFHITSCSCVWVLRMGPTCTIYSMTEDLSSGVILSSPEESLWKIATITLSVGFTLPLWHLTLTHCLQVSPVLSSRQSSSIGHGAVQPVIFVSYSYSGKFCFPWVQIREQAEKEHKDSRPPVWTMQNYSEAAVKPCHEHWYQPKHPCVTSLHSNLRPKSIVNGI